MSVTGNFFTIALMAGSRALSVKNPGLDLESEHACKQRNCIRNISITEAMSLVIIYHVVFKQNGQRSSRGIQRADGKGATGRKKEGLH